MSRRHGILARSLLVSALSNGTLQNVNTGNIVKSGNWRWGDYFTARLGSRSASGAVFQLGRDETKVAKFIFSSGNETDGEIMIGKILGDAGIGPKIYASYVTPITKNRINALEANAKRNQLNWNGKINLFNNYESTPLSSKFNNKTGFDKMYIIIMEKLSGFTLQQVLNNAPGTQNIRVSEKELIDLVTKMHKLGIVHGDMHLNNIYVQVYPNGRTKLKIIDFGRSFMRANNRGFKNPKNVNNYITGKANRLSNGKTVKVLYWFKTANNKPSHVYVAGVPRYRNSAALNNAVTKIRRKYGAPLGVKLKNKLGQMKQKIVKTKNALAYKVAMAKMQRQYKNEIKKNVKPVKKTFLSKLKNKLEQQRNEYNQLRKLQNALKA